jgi:NTP pyrophosphatase (non-canonical NTP hydrolase)
MTLKDAQMQVDAWIKQYGVRYFNELTNLAVLMEETGELARIMARKFGEQSAKQDEEDKQLQDEIADVLFVLICIANQTGIDLTAAFKQNLGKKTKRDQNRHRENKKLK